MSRQQTDILLKEYGQAAGLGEVTLDETGHALLILSEDLFVHLFQPPAAEDLLILADLGPLPPAEKAALVLEDLLTANYLSRADSEGILTLQPETGRVFLLFRPGPIPVEAFFLFMSAVEMQALAWRANYAGLLSDDDDPLGGIGSAEPEEAPEPLPDGALWP